MLNAAVGVQRAIARLRADTGRPSRAAVTIQRRSLSIAHRLSIAHHLRAGSIGWPKPSGERLVQLTTVGVVGLAVALSSLGDAPVGATGNTFGGGTEPRIAVGGDIGGTGDGAWHDALGDGFAPVPAEGNVGVDGLDGTDASIDGALMPNGRIGLDDPLSEDSTAGQRGSLDADGADAAAIRTYRVRTGDTLKGIAARFHVSMMTVWWANHLKSTNDLRTGQTLTIPAVDGLVVTVAPRDTLESLATKYHTDAVDIVALNGLVDRNLTVGQKLVIPGARGAPIATPKPKPSPRPRPAPTSSASGGSTRPPAQYTGGKFAWPVAGGEISQYFHYGHYAIDIAADQGTRVMAAAGGVITFAGWKNNGGGYQVWIAHGSGLSTTYNHMSSISVGRGQHVSRGQGVGRVGMTGNASGPHLHFEVWRGPIWDGGARVNPLIYL